MICYKQQECLAHNMITDTSNVILLFIHGNWQFLYGHLVTDKNKARIMHIESPYNDDIMHRVSQHAELTIKLVAELLQNIHYNIKPFVSKQLIIAPYLDILVSTCLS